MTADPDVEALAERVLDAHLAFARRRLLESGAFDDLIATEIDGFLDDAATITLAEAVTPEMIKDTAYKYAVQMPLAGVIPELAGQIAARLYNHQVQDAVSVDEVIDQRHFDALVAAVADMDATDRIIRRVVGSPAAVDICVEVIVAAIESGLRESAADDEPRGLRERAAARLSSAVAPVWTVIEAGAEKVVRPGARFILDSVKDDGAAQMLDTAREIWRSNASESVGNFREVLTGDDVEDMIVVGIEFWQTFRDTDYFRELLYEAIDQVFDTLGELTLTDILASLGIERSDLVGEAHRFGPPVLAMLDQRGMLDALLRRQLEPFYSSDAFRDAVAPDRGV